MVHATLTADGRRLRPAGRIDPAAPDAASLLRPAVVADQWLGSLAGGAKLLDVTTVVAGEGS